MKTIKVVVTEFQGLNGVDVNSRMFNEDETPIVSIDPQGDEYQLGQISSSFVWAIKDITYDRFKDELDKLFPDAKGQFKFIYKRIPLNLSQEKTLKSTSRAKIVQDLLNLTPQVKKEAAAFIETQELRMSSRMDGYVIPYSFLISLLASFLTQQLKSHKTITK